MAQDAVEVQEVDRLAAAALVKDIYDSRFASARVSEPFDRLLMDEATSLSSYILEADTRTCCILAVSFLEDVLKKNFIDKWDISSRKLHDAHFGSNGPLSTFSQRTLIADRLGWLPADGFRDFDFLRKIRNEFAHNHRIHLLTEEPVHSYASHLREVERIWDKEDARFYSAAYRDASLENRLRMRIFSCVLFAAAQIAARSKLIKHEVPPNYRQKGFFGLLQVEQDMIDLTARHCFAALGIERSGLG